MIYYIICLYIQYFHGTLALIPRTGDVSTPQMSRIAPWQLYLFSAKGRVTSGRSKKKVGTKLGSGWWFGTWDY